HAVIPKSMTKSLFQKIWLTAIIFLFAGTVGYGGYVWGGSKTAPPVKGTVLEGEQKEIREEPQRGFGSGREESSSNDFCTAPPTPLEIGGFQYPIQDEYRHLQFMGQLFTASECGEERFTAVAENFTYPNKEELYTRGINLTLVDSTPQEVIEVLGEKGFECTELSCRLESSIDIRALLDLKEFAEYFQREDCIHCG
ncbi:MAG: hypothetical protein WDZ44_00540, partial [Candidatus Spechtbacterales bacterium]